MFTELMTSREKVRINLNDNDTMETDEASHLDISQLQDDIKNINSTQCPGCEKKFSSKHSCVRHFRVVHLRERHSCDVCNSTFANKDRVKLHIVSSLCFLYHLVIERYPSEKPRPFPLYRYRCLVHVHHLPVKAPLILRHKIYPYFLS